MRAIRACFSRLPEPEPKRKRPPKLPRRGELPPGGALLLLTLSLAALAVAAAPSRPASAKQPAIAARANPDALVVEPIASPAGANSAQPQLTVEGGRAILSWIERANARATVKFAERTPNAWSQPGIVVSSTDLVVNSADVPSVRALADGTLVAHWLQDNGPNPEAYNLVLSWSKDAGRTWSRPSSPHHDGTPTQHGFASLFQTPGAALSLVWLDGRGTRPDAAESAGTGDMALRASTFDAGGRQGDEMVVDPRVCECCPTSAAVTSEGAIVAYRDRGIGDVRDVYVTRFAMGRWSEPIPVHRDGWKLAGCPVNGPSVSVRDREVAVAWFTVQNGQGRALVAFSSDAGRTFGAPVRVDEAGAIGRVQVVALGPGSAAVSWIEFVNGRSELRLRRIGPKGARAASVAITEGLGSQHPRLARRGNELLIAWVEFTRGSTRVRTARAAITSE